MHGLVTSSDDDNDHAEANQFRIAAKARSKQASSTLSHLPKSGGHVSAWESCRDIDENTLVTENGLWVTHVELYESKFLPANLVIPKGTTIHFTVSPNELSMIEYQVAVKCQDVSPTLQRGQTYKFSFCESGYFEAKDTEFRGMKCIIRVVEHERSDEMVQRLMDERAKEKGALLEGKADPRDEDSDGRQLDDLTFEGDLESKEVTDANGDFLSEKQEQVIQESLRIYNKRRAPKVGW